LPQEGLDTIRKAMRLDPHHPPEYLTIFGAAQFGLEQFEVAVTTFERAIKRNPDSEKSLIYLASSYGHLGNMRKAEDTIEAANDLRATYGLSELSLETKGNQTMGPFTGGIDFQSFGPGQAQDRLRLGLSEIPALNWQYLIRIPTGMNDAERSSRVEVEGATKIDLATAKSFYDRGVMFIDIDLKGVWKKGRVAGAVNLPWRANHPGGLRIRETELNKILDKSEEVVFYTCLSNLIDCNPYYETAKAANWGYQKVYFFLGGAPAWKEAGYPIESGD
jgi:tetratricopeptide (TPR) repeat protein